MATQAKPIPAGYHAITPALAARDVAGLIDFYKKVFGAQELYRMDGPDGKIMHADLKIGDSRLMLGGGCADKETSQPESKAVACALYLYVPDVDAVFQRALGAGAKSVMPVADQFWGNRAGQIADPSGHVWWLATHKEDLSPKQMTERAEEFFASHAKS